MAAAVVPSQWSAARPRGGPGTAGQPEATVSLVTVAYQWPGPRPGSPGTLRLTGGSLELVLILLGSGWQVEIRSGQGTGLSLRCHDGSAGLGDLRLTIPSESWSVTVT